ncbi:MAG: hypothetical protein JXQ96_15610 [Cyclobacteriaceae bacterium]
MKKLALIVLACLSPMMIMAHEVPVPHAHHDHVHGFVPFLQYIVLPMVIGFGVLKLYKHYRKSSQI